MSTADSEAAATGDQHSPPVNPTPDVAAQWGTML